MTQLPTLTRATHADPAARYAGRAAPERHWKLADIPWRDIRRDAVTSSEELFIMVTGASLIESTTHLYAGNLIKHFAGDEEIARWLKRGWEREELQHGRALREYVRHAWPDFDWDTVYAGFLRDFSAVAKPEALLPARSLELVSRCVVEMGTAGYYTALSRASADPVLSQLAHNIFEDEVGHYKHFYAYFLQRRDADSVGRRHVAGALWHRLKMLQDEDTYIALKHIWAQRYPGADYDRGVYHRVIKGVRHLAARHFPHPMAVKMLLKPLELPPPAQRAAHWLVESVARHALI